MIPKKIHYCWFGGKPLPEDTLQYLQSWKTHCPDYEIIQWNEHNFDVSSVPYVQQASLCGKWAFVSDYVRLHALYTQGGIYMDTDVEVLKPLDAFLENEAFTGFEHCNAVQTCVLGAQAGHPAVKELMETYQSREFLNEKGEMDLTTNVVGVTDYFARNGLKMDNTLQTVRGFTVYPKDYFSPKNSRTLKMEITENTHTIHHFAASWVEQKTQFRNRMKKLLGPTLSGFVVKVMDKLGIQ